MGSACCCCVKVREAVSKKKRRTIVPNASINLDLVQVHPRIVAMGFPAVGCESLYRNPLGEVKRYLYLSFGDEYHVYNLCAEQRHQYPPSRFDGRVSYYPCWDHLPFPLMKLVDFVHDAGSFLRCSSPEAVVVLHCKAGKGRTGLFACCLMMHLERELFGNPEKAIRLYGSARTYDGNGLTHRSQIRYVGYWGRLQTEYESTFPAGGGPELRLEAVMLRNMPSTIRYLAIVPLSNERGTRVFNVPDPGTDGTSRVPLTTRATEGVADDVVFKDDFRIELRKGRPAGSVVAAVSGHTLFAETSYPVHQMDFLYKYADQYPGACVDLEWAPL